MNNLGFQRRSSSMRSGRPSAQDRQQNQDRNSRIPVRSSSQHNGPGQDMPVFSRSKSNLGMQVASTPRGNAPPNFTPLSSVPMTPLFANSSQKKHHAQKDQRNLQDKEFQREAAHMVLNYFLENSPSTLKNSRLLPMEIKIFINMVNHLFERLGIYHKDTLMQFTKDNYEKEIPVWMKNLDYPGSITKGWLQTVNVPHNWPQVLGLLSWLVSLVIGSDMYDAESKLDEISGEDPKQSTFVHYFLNCMEAHNERARDPNCSLTELCQRQIQIEEEHMGITDEEIQKIEAENMQHMAQLNDPQWQAEKDALDELEQRLAVAESQTAKANEEMDRKNEAINAIKNEAAKKERNIAILKSEAEKCRQDLQNLKGRIESQAMSIAEFAELKKRCDYALKEIEYMEKESEDIEKMTAKYEQDIATKRDKILQNSHAFNRNVIQLEQQVPDLTGLRARVNPESATVVEDLEKQVEALKELKNSLVANCQDLETRRRERAHEVERLKLELQETKETAQKIRDATDKTKAEIEEIKIAKKEEEQTLKEQISDLEFQTTEFQQKENEAKITNKEIEELKERVDLLNRALVATDAKFEEHWKEFEEKMKSVRAQIEYLENQLASQQQEVEKCVNASLKKLKENLRTI